MSDLAVSRLHTDALIAALEAAGLVAGDATSPTEAHGWQGAPGQSQFLGYVIVYPTERQDDGSLGCPDEDSEIEWTVTCVGGSRQQAEWLMGEVDSVLIGQPFTVPGRGIPRVWSPFTGFVRRDDTVQPPTFIGTPRYRIYSVPT